MFYKLINCLLKLTNKTENFLHRINKTYNNFYSRSLILNLEYHIADHCNLNCKCCSHFSPLSDNVFPPIGDFVKSLKRLKQLKAKIGNIRLLGGEPLLNENAYKFMDVARQYFPKTEISLVTNGILLSKQKEDFYNSCVRNNVKIYITKYPIDINYDDIKKFIENKNISVDYYSSQEDIKTMRHNTLDISGKQSKYKMFKQCFLPWNCSFLRNGKIYPCAVAPCSEIFNKFFNQNIILDEKDGIDIYKVKNFREILDFLSKPVPFCRYCDIDRYVYGNKWEVSKKSIEEWT